MKILKWLVNVPAFLIGAYMLNIGVKEFILYYVGIFCFSMFIFIGDMEK